MRAIKIARVDVVYAAFDGAAQNSQRRVAIPGRPENAGTGKLHGAVTKPPNTAAAKAERTGGIYH
ncbi:MAG TPA: hypothetical protein VMF67_14930 [Rhizomicrobium sp.]|nr:hypothetical protein [Rhizomicrobium sp.]